MIEMLVEFKSIHSAKTTRKLKNQFICRIKVSNVANAFAENRYDIPLRLLFLDTLRVSAHLISSAHEAIVFSEALTTSTIAS